MQHFLLTAHQVEFSQLKTLLTLGDNPKKAYYTGMAGKPGKSADQIHAVKSNACQVMSTVAMVSDEILEQVRL